MSFEKSLSISPKLYRLVQPVDHSDLDPSRPGTRKEISLTHGYDYSESSTVTSKDTWETHVEVSGTLGFSEISNITATMGGKLSGETTKSETTTSTFRTSTTTKDTYNFPAGVCTCYYVWGIELAGRTLFLDAGIKSFENPTLAGLVREVEDVESRAEQEIVVIGTPLPPVSEPNPPMTEDRKKLLRRLLSDGKHNIKSYSDGTTYSNESMEGYWNDWAKRDQEATKTNTYMGGRFSVKVSGNFWWYNNGTWYCHMTKDGAIASGTKLDAVSRTF